MTQTYAETLSGDMALDLPEFTHPPADPIELLQRWLASAQAANVREPCAATLATADSSGRVSARIVLVKKITSDGVAIGFSARSRKGHDVTGNPHAALNFYWRERAQQVSLSGTVKRADPTDSDDVFAARPRTAQALARKSHQSEPTTAARLAEIRAEVDQLARQTNPIVRPSTWSVWTIRPDEIEFWHADPDRFHRRLRYQRDGDHYQRQRLQP